MSSISTSIDVTLLVSRIGKSGQNGRSLWLDEQQPSFIQGQTQDVFMQALSFLQTYDPKYIGGIERVLQVATELAQRREQDSSQTQQPPLSLGARFSMWRGRAPQTQALLVPVVDPRKRTSDFPSDGTETTKTTQATLASTISNTFWRGITNQTAMEDEQASTPPSPSPEPTIPIDTTPNAPTVTNGGTSNIWGYAEKLKSSDAVASISKVSSNWRAKAILGPWGLTGSAISNSNEKGYNHAHSPSKTYASLPVVPSPGLLSPPPVPPKMPTRSPSPLALSPPTSSGLLEKTKHLISKRSSAIAPTPKSAPKPLLLGLGSPIISGHKKLNHPRSASATQEIPDTDEWADVMQGKRHHFHRDSQSSVSSLSPSDALGFSRTPKSTKSEYESDTSSSRIVAINRRSISPMAPNFRVMTGRSLSRPSSRASSASSDFHDLQSPPLPSVPPVPSYLARSPLQESSSFDVQPLVIAPEPHESENSDTTSSEMPLPTRKPSWKKQVHASDSEATAPGSNLAKSPRVRSKRQARPANLQIQEQHPRVSAEQKSPSHSSLTVEWPGDEQENITTPRAANFESDGYVSVSPGLPKSPRRARKMSSTDQEKPRKSSMDTIMNEERPRKVSTGHRARKVSTGSREVPRSRRESAAEEGDDEGYDELLSAYESEDGPPAPYLH